MPLSELNRDVFRALHEDELAVVEIHHVVAQLHAGPGKPRDLAFQVID
ncbi:MAG: hypothetical protein WBX25_05250 [Rhodomicrobium sp.]